LEPRVAFRARRDPVMKEHRMKTTRILLAAFAAGALTFVGASTTSSAFAATPTAKQPASGSDQDKAATEGAKVGEKAPDFTLTDTSGKTFTLSEATKEGKIVVIEWFNPECPVIVAHHEKHPTFKNMAKEFAGKDVVIVAINSTAAGKPGSEKSLNAEKAKAWGMDYPVLLDPDSKVARQYGAKTTPHMFVIDKDGVLAYSGAIDNGSAAKPGDTNYVTQAVNELLAGQTVTTAQTRPYGCSVKYAN
jgi:peroxiredoxin